MISLKQRIITLCSKSPLGNRRFLLVAGVFGLILVAISHAHVYGTIDNEEKHLDKSIFRYHRTTRELCPDGTHKCHQEEDSGRRYRSLRCELHNNKDIEKTVQTSKESKKSDSGSESHIIYKREDSISGDTLRVIPLSSGKNVSYYSLNEEGQKISTRAEAGAEAGAEAPQQKIPELNSENVGGYITIIMSNGDQGENKSSESENSPPQQGGQTDPANQQPAGNGTKQPGEEDTSSGKDIQAPRDANGGIIPPAPGESGSPIDRIAERDSQKNKQQPAQQPEQKQPEQPAQQPEQKQPEQPAQQQPEQKQPEQPAQKQDTKRSGAASNNSADSGSNSTASQTSLDENGGIIPREDEPYKTNYESQEKSATDKKKTGDSKDESKLHPDKPSPRSDRLLLNMVDAFVLNEMRTLRNDSGAYVRNATDDGFSMYRRADENDTDNKNARVSQYGSYYSPQDMSESKISSPTPNYFYKPSSGSGDGNSKREFRGEKTYPEDKTGKYESFVNMERRQDAAPPPGAPQPGPNQQQPGAPPPGSNQQQPGAPQPGPNQQQPGAPQPGPGQQQPGAPQPGPDQQQPGAPPPGPDQQQPGAPPSGFSQQQPGVPPPGPDQQQPGAPPPGPDQQQPGAPPPGPDQQQPGAPPGFSQQQPGAPPPGPDQQQPGAPPGFNQQQPVASPLQPGAQAPGQPNGEEGKDPRIVIINPKGIQGEAKGGNSDGGSANSARGVDLNKLVDQIMGSTKSAGKEGGSPNVIVVGGGGAGDNGKDGIGSNTATDSILGNSSSDSPAGKNGKSQGNQGNKQEGADGVSAKDSPPLIIAVDPEELKQKKGAKSNEKKRKGPEEGGDTASQSIEDQGGASSKSTLSKQAQPAKNQKTRSQIPMSHPAQKAFSIEQSQNLRLMRRYMLS